MNQRFHYTKCVCVCVYELKISSKSLLMTALRINRVKSGKMRCNQRMSDKNLSVIILICQVKDLNKSWGVKKRQRAVNTFTAGAQTLHKAKKPKSHFTIFHFTPYTRCYSFLCECAFLIVHKIKWEKTHFPLSVQTLAKLMKCANFLLKSNTGTVKVMTFLRKFFRNAHKSKE